MTKSNSFIELEVKQLIEEPNVEKLAKNLKESLLYGGAEKFLLTYLEEVSRLKVAKRTEPIENLEDAFALVSKRDLLLVLELKSIIAYLAKNFPKTFAMALSRTDDKKFIEEILKSNTGIEFFESCKKLDKEGKYDYFALLSETFFKEDAEYLKEVILSEPDQEVLGLYEDLLDSENSPDLDPEVSFENLVEFKQSQIREFFKDSKFQAGKDIKNQPKKIQDLVFDFASSMEDSTISREQKMKILQSDLALFLMEENTSLFATILDKFIISADGTRDQSKILEFLQSRSGKASANYPGHFLTVFNQIEEKSEIVDVLKSETAKVLVEKSPATFGLALRNTINGNDIVAILESRVGETFATKSPEDFFNALKQEQVRPWHVSSILESKSGEALVKKSPQILSEVFKQFPFSDEVIVKILRCEVGKVFAEKNPEDFAKVINAVCKRKSDSVEKKSDKKTAVKNLLESLGTTLESFLTKISEIRSHEKSHKNYKEFKSENFDKNIAEVISELRKTHEKKAKKSPSSLVSNGLGKKVGSGKEEKKSR